MPNLYNNLKHKISFGIGIGIIAMILAVPSVTLAITEVTTGNPTNLTPDGTGVTLNGSANPDGDWTVGYFRYSAVAPGNISPVFCNDIFGSNMMATNEVNLGNGTTPVAFPTIVTGLHPNTTYYYCAIASNPAEGLTTPETNLCPNGNTQASNCLNSDDEINYTGGVNSFTTSMPDDCVAPNTLDSNGNCCLTSTMVDNLCTSSPITTNSVTTDAALVVDSSSAYLNGFFNSGISASETWFEYREKTGGGITPVINTNTNTNNYMQATKGNSLGTTATYSSWQQVDNENHASETSGSLNFLLKGLSPGTYQFRAGIENAGGIFGKIVKLGFSPTYGDTLTFQISKKPIVFPFSPIVIPITPNECTNPSDPHCNGTQPNNYVPTEPVISVPHTLGEIVTAPVDAVVHAGEGIETVFARQIVDNSDIAEEYGYTSDKDLQSYAWYLADVLAKAFGYVSASGKEIRVSKPDVAAYELQLTNGDLTVYEYYNSKIVNIQKLSNTLRGKYFYEYYFKK